MAPAVSSLDNTLGVLVIASFLNSSLFTNEIWQTAKYFRRYPPGTDSLFNQICIIVALLGDIVSVIASLAAVYLFCITHWGDVAFVITSPWPMPMHLLGTGITAAVCQIFLTARLYKLAKATSGQLVSIIVLAMVCLMISTAVAGTVGLAVFVNVYNTLAERGKLEIWTNIALIASATTDLTISIALVYFLMKSTSDFQATGNLIRRLIISSLRNGSITAAWAISSVIAYRIKPHENIAVFFTITFGRLYTLTMLSNLNMRDSLARESQTSSGRIRSSNALALGDVSGGRGRSNFGGRGGSKKGTGAESQHGGVQIHREQVTHFEINDPEFEQGIAVPSEISYQTYDGADESHWRKSVPDDIEDGLKHSESDSWEVENSQMDLIDQHDQLSQTRSQPRR